jgi:hypothetical protein
MVEHIESGDGNNSKYEVAAKVDSLGSTVDKIKTSVLFCAEIPDVVVTHDDRGEILLSQDFDIAPGH